MSESIAWTYDPAARQAEENRRISRIIRWMAPLYAMAVVCAYALLRRKIGGPEARQFTIIALVAFAVMASFFHAWAPLVLWILRREQPVTVNITYEEIRIGTITIRLSDIVRITKHGKRFLVLHLRNGSTRTLHTPKGVSRERVKVFLEGRRCPDEAGMP